MKKFRLCIGLFGVIMAQLIAIAATAAEPDGYYDSCEGKSGKDLLRQLQSVIGDHTTINYKTGLWTVYETSDVRPDGTLWDMYSTKHWPKNFTKCGNYKAVGDCVNKEHSMPKSWFNDASPMYSDAYHLYPTDGRVNGQRSNLPYGECANGTQLAANGSVKPLGKVGTSTFPGYSDKVFEPDDEYKGDFARTYFYMAACYNSRIGTWSSPMLAGNSYPAYTTWAVNLLLKWHRQDPVSQKELDRNEAVAKHQHNRNPFIDHPELAEYIWGNKIGIGWSASASNQPQFLAPADESKIDLGMVATGVKRSQQIQIKGINLSSNISVTVSGNGFSATPITLDYKTVNNDGATLTVSCTATTATSLTGSLTLTSGDVTTTVHLAATAVDGLPISEATDISENSFTIRWTCIDTPETNYTLTVNRDGLPVNGYPRTVRGGDEQAIVSGLEPETAYTVTVASPSLSSRTVTATTTAPLPSVTFLYDGELEFFANPGVPSNIAELLMDVENIPGDITLSVTAPFELSTDKTDWKRSIIIAPGEDRFYLRMFGQTEGNYTTTLTATADDGFRNDDVDIEGRISAAAASFIEDFEPNGDATYNKQTYVGTASTWEMNGIYFEKNGTNSYPHNGQQAARTNKNGSRYMTMMLDKPYGAGTVSFWAELWRDDTTPAAFEVLVSTDSGSTWETAGTTEVKPTAPEAGAYNVYAEYSVKVEKTGNIRMKLNQTSGGRVMIDDLSITDFAGNDALDSPETVEYHTWDAFCRNHCLILENIDEKAAADNIFSVYSIDGTEYFTGTTTAGETTLDLPDGMYIVVVRDFSRRVLVK